MNDFYVYGLIDPETGMPFYIGKGRKGRAKRHISKVRRGESSENSLKDSKIQSLLEKLIEPVIHYYHTNLEEDVAYNLETALIAQYGRLRIDDEGILLNRHLAHPMPPQNTGKTRFPSGHSPWNKGKRGFIHTEETKKKMSQTRMGSPSPTRGRIMPEEEKLRRSKAAIGHKVSNETREKLSKIFEGRYISPETRQKMKEAHIGKPRPDIAAMQRKRLSDPKQLEKHKEMCRMREARRRLARELRKK